MIKNKKVIAIILARVGSKRLPSKNIKIFRGEPLIGWTIQAAKKSHYIDRVIVSTDSSEIAWVARQFGAQIPFIRPLELSSDTATSESGIVHTLEWIQEHEKKTYDYFVYLQPTSPLRTEKHIDEALELFDKSKKASMLISVTKYDKNPYWIQTVNKNNYLRGFFDSSNTFPKIEKQLYFPNGSIYIGDVKRFLKNKKLYTMKAISYIMDKSVSIDIDEEIDFIEAEYFAKR